MRINSGGRLRRIALVLSLGVLAALAIVGATSARATNDDSPKKVFVCKYVGTPGVNERLQTGGNPINVSVNAIPDGASVGAYFADAQGRSFVLAFDTGQPEPSASSCPAPAPDDVCPNIDGVQDERPAGHDCGRPEQLCSASARGRVSESGRRAGARSRRLSACRRAMCQMIPPPPHRRVPEPRRQPGRSPGGDGQGRAGRLCHPPAASHRRVPEHRRQPGQKSPEGMVKDGQGSCVTPPPPTTPTTPPTDEFMDVQVIKDATPQVQLVNGQADIAYTIRVRNNSPTRPTTSSSRTQRRTGSRSSR